MRLLPLAFAITLATACAVAPAQENKLPDIGSSAGELLTPARQAEYGKMMLAELRSYGYVLEDPLIDDWLQTMGTRLGANSDQPQQKFTFFMLRDRQINAFATLGGYVAVNAGLVLTAEREDEVAAVLSHEIAHVTQQHVLRGVERAQRDQIPILLGMLAAVVAAQQAGGRSSGDATQAAIASGLGLMQQRQIDYTRSNESEADRLGIRTLARSGYDVDAMAGFFERMSLAMRGNQGGYSTPDFLMTHPVTTTRISEARERAEQMKKNTLTLTTSVPGGSLQERVDPNDVSLSQPLGAPSNPLLPGGLQLPFANYARGPSGQFEWARERLRVFSANTPADAIREYEGLRQGSKQGLSDAQRYGLALARLRAGGSAQDVAQTLEGLLQAHPDNWWLTVAVAEAEAKAGHNQAADQRFEALVKRMPSNRAVALSYAGALNEQGGRQAGQRAQAVLRPLLGAAAEDPVFQRTFARACELAGDDTRAGEAYAEAAYLNGHPEQALIQLNNLKKRSDLDYVARARIDARIAAITPTVLELRRQGVQDPDMQRR
ncbi:putative Zn-dependent protease [Xanthomonas sacchari]|uniref:M48 family metalloprotease n=1 Tax=Xanthomonas sacchari TaxID=56458 RepID=UPI0020C2573D|nr:M48 family metalloprotease [Xanthomonas sacchari]MDQ1094303.1 putative Zn-dependent protease [Xanthomonas sacchari]